MTYQTLFVTYCSLEWAFSRFIWFCVALSVIGCVIAVARYRRPMASYRSGRFPP